MSKLARKFLLSLSAVLLSVTLLSLYLNANFIERYFLYQEKKDLNRICDELAESEDLEAAIIRLEDTEDVVIAQGKSTDDNDRINERLRLGFLEKGLGIEKFWLWEEDRQAVLEENRIRRIYGQEKLHYSLLVEYVRIEDKLLAAAKIIPSVQNTISLINFVTAGVFFSATLLMLLIIYFLVKKITAPLTAIGQTARAISKLDFQTIQVKTGNELELLAEDINHMSRELKTAHEGLEMKNRQMESLLANVSHDLKTPVSLVKAYTSGMKDGMDDGTFLDTIIVQNGKMEQMIQRLLDLGKLQKQELFLEDVDVSAVLENTLLEFQLQADNRGLRFRSRITPGIVLLTGKEDVQSIFSNLLSNAVKYALKGDICLKLEKSQDKVLFTMQNEIDPVSVIDRERLWEPFYVGEKSRNKDMSGTGLGLSIVRTAAQKYGYECIARLESGWIEFEVKF